MNMATENGNGQSFLSPEQRAERALAFSSTLERLRALAKESVSLVSVDTEDNLAAAKAAKARLQSTRVLIEKTGKAARDDATKFGKAVIAKERELIAVISPEEARLSDMIASEQRRIAEAERVAREAEQRRAEVIRVAFERVRSLPGLAASMDVAGIDALIAEAQALHDDPSHLPDELHTAARYEANVAINGCKAARDRRVQADLDAVELEQLRREKAAREAEARAAEAETKASAERIDENPAAVPAATVPDVYARHTLSLLDASRAALVLLRRSGLGGAVEALDLADAIDYEIELRGGVR